MTPDHTTGPKPDQVPDLSPSEGLQVIATPSRRSRLPQQRQSSDASDRVPPAKTDHVVLDLETARERLVRLLIVQRVGFTQRLAEQLSHTSPGARRTVRDLERTDAALERLAAGVYAEYLPQWQSDLQTRMHTPGEARQWCTMCRGPAGPVAHRRAGADLAAARQTRPSGHAETDAKPSGRAA